MSMGRTLASCKAVARLIGRGLSQASVTGAETGVEGGDWEVWTGDHAGASCATARPSVGHRTPAATSANAIGVTRECRQHRRMLYPFCKPLRPGASRQNVFDTFFYRSQGFALPKHLH